MQGVVLVLWYVQGVVLHVGYFCLVCAGSRFGLRWFTPAHEIKLCGHATLASAAVLFYQLGELMLDPSRFTSFRLLGLFVSVPLLKF